MAALADRLTVLDEPVERDRPAQLGERKRSRQRVLAPPLHPAENAGSVDEAALLVDGVPPEQEPRLLIGRDEPLTGELAAGGSNVLEQPSENRSEEHTSELQSRENLVCRLLLEKKN